MVQQVILATLALRLNWYIIIVVEQHGEGDERLQTSAIILAAGAGKRMQSKTSKVLHNLCGRPMVEHVIRACTDVGISRFYVVIGRDASQLRERLGEGYTYVLQAEQLGTGHAALQVKPHYQHEPHVFVLCGDAPLITGATLERMQQIHFETKADVTVLTAIFPQPGDYGRVLRDANGQVCGLVEAKDAAPEQKAIKEINTGFYCFRAEELFKALDQLTNDNAQGEYYLTDVIQTIYQAGGRVVSCLLEDNNESLGINDRVRLAEAEGVLRQRIRNQLMLAGVTFLQPETCLVDATVSIGQDTIVYPGVILEGETTIGHDCVIGPQTHLVDCQVGDGVSIEFSVARQSKLGDNCIIGPYAYLRPQTELGAGVKVGDFVELKNSQVGAGSKIPHLSYVGDATIGSGVNIGAGTIFVNYDGRKKYRSVVEDGAFIGCNSNLVAPVHIGQDAYVAAGSTLTKDVPSGSLAVARSRQENKEGWVAKRRQIE